MKRCAMARARIAIQAPDFVSALRWRQIAEKRLAEEHAERDRLEERARQSASRFHASAAEAAEHARAEAEERARAKDEAAEAAARRGEIREELYGAARRERVGYASTLASQFATGTEMGQPVSPGSAAGSVRSMVCLGAGSADRYTWFRVGVPSGSVLGSDMGCVSLLGSM